VRVARQQPSAAVRVIDEAGCACCTWRVQLAAQQEAQRVSVVAMCSPAAAAAIMDELCQHRQRI